MFNLLRVVVKEPKARGALPRSFYMRDVVTVSRDLLGKIVVHDSPQGRTSGRIVETEAYEQTEAACHAYQKRTERNRAMYGPGGYAYVYFSYGMHWMLNVVVGEADFAAAVLIRALEPIDGIDLMSQRRGVHLSTVNLTNGPGKLAQAMGIDAACYGADLTRGPLTIIDAPALEPVLTSPRIGISQAIDLPWRFFVANPYVSKTRASLASSK